MGGGFIWGWNGEGNSQREEEGEINNEKNKETLFYTIT